MRLLDEIDLYLNEDDDEDVKKKYRLYPTDFDAESGVSFGVEPIGKDRGADEDNDVAKIIIRNHEGVPIGALGGDYDYKDVFADINVDGDKDSPDNIQLIKWIIDKLITFGYDKETTRVNGREVFISDHEPVDISNPEELQDADSDINFDSYWKNDDDDDVSDELGSEFWGANDDFDAEYNTKDYTDDDYYEDEDEDDDLFGKSKNKNVGK
jgi:hypothetical protein